MRENSDENQNADSTCFSKYIEFERRCHKLRIFCCTVNSIVAVPAIISLHHTFVLDIELEETF